MVYPCLRNILIVFLSYVTKEATDHLLFLLQYSRDGNIGRIGKQFGYSVGLQCKPFTGDCSLRGCGKTISGKEKQNCLLILRGERGFRGSAIAEDVAQYHRSVFSDTLGSVRRKPCSYLISNWLLSDPLELGNSRVFL